MSSPEPTLSPFQGLMTFSDAAAELRCAERTLRRRVSDGEIAAIALGARRYVERAELVDYLARQRAEANRRRAAAAKARKRSPARGAQAVRGVT